MNSFSIEAFFKAMGAFCPFDLRLDFFRHIELFLICFFIFMSHWPALGQPVFMSTVPASFQEGDTISILVHYGTEEEPVYEIDHVDLIIPLEGFTISAASPLQLGGQAGSWLCDFNACSGSASYSSSENAISLSLTSDSGLTSGGEYLITILEVYIEVVDFPLRHPRPDFSIVSLFPNPSNGTFTLRVPDGEYEAEWSLTSMTGAQVAGGVMSGKTEKTISIDQPHGVYFFSIRTSNGVFRKKVTIEP